MLEESPMKQQNSNRKFFDHSLAPDIFTGWNHKSITPKLKQFPLIFAHPKNDLISKTLTSFGSDLPYKVVYMGFRPSSNMKVFKQYGQNKQSSLVHESFLYNNNKQLKRFKFHHFTEPQKYFPIRSNEYRLFTGVNPTFKNQDIKFSSQFQGGNLDLAINVGPFQYDLLMRVDSNTKGHTNWYFFKVSNIKKNMKVRFNIINFCKNNELYTEGMKPYVFRTSKMKWNQQGKYLQFKSKAYRYFNQNDDPFVSKCLSFTIQFTQSQQQVYFAYCIPYSYSYLINILEQLQKKYTQFIRINYNEETTGGLALPIVTITNFTKQNDKKKCLVIGRLHAGQPQGSWMVDGFMRYICSPQASYLRDKIQFKIIPMVNIDGVILGNFRTGIGGRDLNRIFNDPSRFNEIKIIKNEANNLKPDFFLDFHGHSAKRNVFIYGPDYKIQHKDYLLSRLFPKIISKKCDAFRYYSCIFRISDSKKTTGRAILFNQYNTRFVFTIEASTQGYGNIKQITNFNAQKYIQVGNKIAESLQDFIKLLYKPSKRAQIELQKRQISNRMAKKSMNTQSNQSFFKSENIESERQNDQDLELQLLEQIIKNQKQFAIKNKKMKNNQQSDSDFEDQANDYTQKQLLQMQKNPQFLKLKKNDLKGKKKTYRKKNQFKNNMRKQKSSNIKSFDSSILLSSVSNNNKSLILARQTIKQSYANYRFRNPVSSQQLNQQQNLQKKQFRLQFNARIRSQNNQSKNENAEKICKIIEFKNFQLNKICQTDNMRLNRIKSTNQVTIQSQPQQNDQFQNKKLPKIKSQIQKKQPMFLIKKSFLPSSIQRPTNRVFETLDKLEVGLKRQKSLVDQILQLNQRKKKRQQFSNKNKKLKILYFQE